MIAEAFKEYCNSADKFEADNKRVHLFIESTIRELEINKEEATLKVMTESGTEDDLLYLEEVAEEGAIARIKKAITVIIEAFKQAMSDLKSKIVRVICNAETKSVLKKVEAKIKLNPILSRKKVSVIDKKKPLAIISKYKSIADKDIAKIKSGILKETDITSISKTREDYSREYKAAIAGTAALITVTVSKLVADINSEYGKLPSHIDKVDKDTSTILNSLLATLDKEEAASAKAAFTAVANFRTKIGKDEANEHIDAIMNKLSVLKKEVLKAKDPVGDKTVVATNESYEDGIEGLFDGFMESSDGFDMFAMEASQDADSLLDELEELI